MSTEFQVIKVSYWVLNWNWDDDQVWTEWASSLIPDSSRFNRLLIEGASRRPLSGFQLRLHRGRPPFQCQNRSGRWPKILGASGRLRCGRPLPMSWSCAAPRETACSPLPAECSDSAPVLVHRRRWRPAHMTRSSAHLNECKTKYSLQFVRR